MTGSETLYITRGELFPTPTRGSETFISTKGAPIFTGIRGPQIEPLNLQIDRLINATSNTLSITPGVNLASTGLTTIFTASQKTYILGVLLRVSAADTVTTVAEASIGINPSIDNIFANEPLVVFDAVDEMYTFWNNLNTGVILNSSDVLQISVNTAATATMLTASVYVIGVLL